MCFVDLFGGSGLLSHTIRHCRPEARVIYNDFDGYSERLAHISKTNGMLDKLRGFCSKIPKGQRMPHDIRENIIDEIREYAEKGEYVDYITLSSALLFTGKYAKDMNGLIKETFYNKLPKSAYSCDGYLDGVEVVKSDYRELFERYSKERGIVFIVDPPYLSTDVSSYECYWRLSDFLDVLKILEGHDYVYFTSEKSNVIELCDWLGKNRNMGNPFDNASRVDISAKIAVCGVAYQDIMIYKKAG